MRAIRCPALAAVLLSLSVFAAGAQTYEKDILPILEKNCQKCHNNDKMKGGVSVDVADMKSDVGRIIIPGDPRESMLLEVLVRDDIKNKMPPKGGPLPDKDIAKIRQWIQDGARFDGDAGGDDKAVAASALAKKPLAGNWTNKAGKVIKADLIKVDGDKAVLRLPNGKIYHYPLAELAEESAQRAKEFAAQ